GPNGAGKSTLIKLILNMTTRDAGRIEVLGLDAMADEERAKEQLGVVLDSSYFIEYMTVDAVERTSSPMYPLWDHNLFDAYLRRFGLGRNKKIKDLSRGMQMKLMLAVALSHDAKLLILDEPTSGLDPIGTREMKDMILNLKEQGKTVVMCSHLLADVQDVCDRIAILHQGELKELGRVDSLLKVEDTTQIRATGLTEECQNEIRSVIERHQGKLVSMDNPTTTLEELFLSIVQDHEARPGRRVSGRPSDEPSGGDQGQSPTPA
ncbi:MAG: ABC transporter ATP-binding protein, partial [Planctomycetales bacterium]|nr:ABC transporter ATP-binding protein [Planctomycetales bacterium]